MDITLRPAAFSDFTLVQSINRQAPLEVSTIDADYFHAMLGAQYFVIAEIEHSVVGYVCAFSDRDDYDGEEYLWFRQTFEQPFLYIDQVAIAQPLRRRGVGRYLYTQAMAFSARNRFRYLLCEVNVKPRNAASLSFHERLGFEPVGSMEVRDVKVLLLRKRIS